MGRISLSSKEMPQDNALENLYKTRLHDSEQLKTVLTLYDQDFEQKDGRPSYQRLNIMAKKFVD